MPVELPTLFVHTEQTIVEFKLRGYVVCAVVKLGELCTCHGVDILHLVVLEHAGCRLQHGVVLACVGTCQRILFVDAHVRHLLVCYGEQVIIVLLVLGIGERKVG